MKNEKGVKKLLPDNHDCRKSEINYILLSARCESCYFCTSFIPLFAFLFPLCKCHLFQPLCSLFEHSVEFVRFLLGQVAMKLVQEESNKWSLLSVLLEKTSFICSKNIYYLELFFLHNYKKLVHLFNSLLKFIKIYFYCISTVYCDFFCFGEKTGKRR